MTSSASMTWSLWIFFRESGMCMDWTWLTFRPGMSSRFSSDWTNGGRLKHDERTSSQDDGRGIMITRNTVASQLRDYLQHRTTRASLVDWAERAMMEEEFDEGDLDTIRDITSRPI